VGEEEAVWGLQQQSQDGDADSRAVHACVRACVTEEGDGGGEKLGCHECLVAADGVADAHEETVVETFGRLGDLEVLSVVFGVCLERLLGAVQ
jgi:hypothetical protein